MTLPVKWSGKKSSPGPFLENPPAPSAEEPARAVQRFLASAASVAVLTREAAALTFSVTASW